MVTTPKMQTIRITGIPGRAMMATSAARLRSQAIITCLRGSRSASPDRVRPPTKAGTMLSAKVMAASSAECVRAKTSRVMRDPGQLIARDGQRSARPRAP